ncbi:MAG TPA: hypothetical protein VI874_02965 [Candidatus Norongarragalinales archaeon]|nr:hypothetical protein [Candidatus Norongarragalinales archaeon]
MELKKIAFIAVLILLALALSVFAYTQLPKGICPCYDGIYKTCLWIASCY